MYTLRSPDGTSIAFDKTGQGPPLIMVDGALCSRAIGPGRSLAPNLAERFTVYTYDRRGRGESSDTPPYAVEREIEDLNALIAEAGGSAYVFGLSSGAALALEAAAQAPRSRSSRFMSRRSSSMTAGRPFPRISWLSSIISLRATAAATPSVCSCDRSGRRGS
jgi:pimeloyl-ACP methyl ester carboxylesterase